MKTAIRARMGSIKQGIGRHYQEFCRQFPRTAGLMGFMLLDNVGSMGLSDGFIESMKREGMKVRYVMNSSGKFNRFQEGFPHQKVMLVDDSISAIGSANLDNRSFRLNFEVIGIVSDAAFNAEVSHML